MAKARTAGETARPPKEERSWGQLLAASLLIGSVAGVLLLGAILAVEPGAHDLDSAATRSIVPSVPEATEPDRALTLLAPAPEVGQARALERPVAADRASAWETDPLARRVSLDLARVSDFRGQWTAQLALLCDPARARERLGEFAGEPDLYLLPAEHAGQACFLLCFGHFASADQAKTADLPVALRAIQPQPFPKKLSDILEVLE